MRGTTLPIHQSQIITYLCSGLSYQEMNFRVSLSLKNILGKTDEDLQRCNVMRADRIDEFTT